jgi:hypothetical protein
MSQNVGYLYIIQIYKSKNKITKKYKIGRTKSVDDRIKTSQTYNPDELIIVKQYPCNNVCKLEKTVHKQFKEYNIRGEWFSFTDDQLQLCMNFIDQEIEKNNMTCNPGIRKIKKLQKYRCEYCSFKAQNPEEFCEHVKTDLHQDIFRKAIAKILEYECPLCKVKTTNSDEFWHHDETAHGEEIL